MGTLDKGTEEVAAPWATYPSQSYIRAWRTGACNPSPKFSKLRERPLRLFFLLSGTRMTDRTCSSRHKEPKTVLVAVLFALRSREHLLCPLASSSLKVPCTLYLCRNLKQQKMAAIAHPIPRSPQRPCCEFASSCVLSTSEYVAGQRCLVRSYRVPSNFSGNPSFVNTKWRL